ncbi:NAD(P)-binding protein [Aspergillus welwitschiae]|uniref:NAD(P)-binding protein n=1 Tax=Aspergillus welwitschiae TaxID=1341132 RepID=A0A3F3QIK4_9EURO|nr:NAD(P)-binding protein [Aspergillus welwitschiae]RDH38702.1 NAD(P)-binding protein [Aspergillus welwitschiae]
MAPALGQIFPPNPTFVEKDMPDLTGKVTIVTGATSGVGFNTASILYSKNATVYIAARSADKARTAINEIQTSAEGAHSRGRLSFLQLDLSNLASIKESANKFLELEDRLDILIHNAGVMTPPAGSKTITGHDLEMGTNCLGPFLFNKFLLPLIQRTTAAAPAGSVRVVWLSSMISSFTANGGIIFDEESGAPKVLSDPMQNYMESKVGNVFIAKEMANRYGGEGILSLSVHPGLMKTELQRHSSAIQATVMGWIFKGPRYGAYSELFAALSPEVTQEKNGAYIIPWGRFGPIPCHLQKGLVSKRDGGAGTAERFWSWCEKETAPYL